MFRFIKKVFVVAMTFGCNVTVMNLHFIVTVLT